MGVDVEVDVEVAVDVDIYVDVNVDVAIAGDVDIDVQTSPLKSAFSCVFKKILVRTKHPVRQFEHASMCLESRRAFAQKNICQDVKTRIRLESTRLIKSLLR